MCVTQMLAVPYILARDILPILTLAPPQPIHLACTLTWLRDLTAATLLQTLCPNLQETEQAYFTGSPVSSCFYLALLQSCKTGRVWLTVQYGNASPCLISFVGFPYSKTQSHIRDLVPGRIFSLSPTALCP